MPVNPNADIEITAFNWVPPFAKGIVRDLRVRWALEEMGLDYRTRLLHAGQAKPEGYVKEQPFEQVPVYRDNDVHLFESGAILLYLGEKHAKLLPTDTQEKSRAIGWMFAALNSVEPAIQNLAMIDSFYRGEEWAKLRRPGAENFARTKLKRISDWLGDRDYLEDQFTVGDIMMTTVLRIGAENGLVGEFDNLVAYKQRCEDRPAFQAALDAHMADFTETEPA